MLPTTCMEFLGFIIDSVEYSIAITGGKRQKLRFIIENILSFPHKKIHIKLLAKIIGIIVSFFPASDLARLHYRKLERFKIKQLRVGSWKMHVKLNTECLDELKWWVHYLKSDIKKSLHSPAFMAEIYTDASFEGFGRSWNGREFQGKFTEKQKQLSINTKELLAIYYTLRVHVTELKDQVVLFHCDNTTALFCMKSLGSRDVLRDRITSKIYHLACLYNITLKCSYINTKLNKSDRASRVFKQKSVHTEWSLHSSDFQKILNLSSTLPEVDMFASEANKKLPQFISWHPCKDAMHVDAFTCNWGNIRGFLFAPFHCLASVLKKCLDDKVENTC